MDDFFTIVPVFILMLFEYPRCGLRATSGGCHFSYQLSVISYQLSVPPT
ncbi:MAG: hypothetical protein F6K17_03815 [Okeania sp. SIO3C4]|nr:hypothetical protein [Okeania sp. SIO3C4]